MSPDVQLSRKQLAQIEPSEGDEREQIMLSPFAIPNTLHIEMNPSGVRSIRLAYSGGETGENAERLDGQNDPGVIIAVSRDGQKVSELRFSNPIRSGDLLKIANRIETTAERLPPKTAKRLSFRLIAQVLRTMLAPMLRDFESKFPPPRKD